MTYPSKLQLFALAFYQFMVADAQNCNRSSPFDNGYNGTGSVTTPGFRVNDSYPESAWTWSQFVVDDYNNATNRSMVWQTFGLETAPVQNLTDPSLPYTACIIALTGVKGVSNAASDNGSCNSMLSSDCIRHIISQVNLTASQISNTVTASSSSYSCTDLLGTSSISKGSPCYGQWDGSISSRFMPNTFTGYTNPICPPVENPGESNVSSRAFFSWGGYSTAPDNYTYYDQAIRKPQPIIVAAYLKNTNSTNVGNAAWADTRLMCLPGNITAPGSRNITEANKTAGAGRLGGAAFGMFGIVALTTLFALL